MNFAAPAMMPCPHLLVVDDDADIVDVIQRYFTAQRFIVSTAAHGTAMRQALANQRVDVVLLDLGLPDEDGLTLTRHLRKHWHGGLVIITGRGESIDRVVGLELGADDYVTKPFDLRELLARVRSVLRRIGETAVSSERSHVLHFGRFRLNTAVRELFGPDGVLVPLTTGEYDLLCVLLAHPNRVLSRDDLMNHLHGREAGPNDRAIDVQIGRLRRKLETDPAKPLLIKSVRGAGYLFATRVVRELNDEQ